MYRKEKYKAAGLVEVLIAMAVASIAISAFINMTSDNYREAIRYEREDALNRVAYDGATAVRRYAESTRDPDPGTGGDEFQDGFCYEIDLEGNNADILDRNERVNPDDLEDIESIETIEYDGGTVDIEEEVYMGFCIDNVEDGDDYHLYMGEIATGYVNGFEGIEEYTYNLAVIIYEDF